MYGGSVSHAENLSPMNKKLFATTDVTDHKVEYGDSPLFEKWLVAQGADKYYGRKPFSRRFRLKLVPIFLMMILIILAATVASAVLKVMHIPWKKIIKLIAVVIFVVKVPPSLHYGSLVRSAATMNVPNVLARTNLLLVMVIQV